MTAYAVKLIAVFTMLIDHAAYILRLCGLLGGMGYGLMRSVGRIAFVLFAFLLVNGIEKTSNPHRYFSRLSLFAVISQVPFSMAFSSENYTADAVTATGFYVSFYPAWTLALLSFGIWLTYFGCVCRWKPDWSLLTIAAALTLPLMYVTAGGYTLIGSNLSIFYTLAFSVALCLSASALIEAIKARDHAVSALGGLWLIWAGAYCGALRRALKPCDTVPNYRALVHFGVLCPAWQYDIRALRHAGHHPHSAL